MDILDLHRSGLSQRAIARRLGISRNTVKKYINHPIGVLSSREAPERKSILDPFHDMIRGWLDEDEYYTAAWIYDRLVSQGCTGSCETFKRKVGSMKQQRQKIAYMRLKLFPAIRHRLISANSMFNCRMASSKSCTCFP